jgi:hypothetical protein
MSGPKVSAYQLRLRRIRKLKAQSANLENDLEEKLLRLAVSDALSAATIRASLCCTDWDDESALQEYKKSLEQAFVKIKSEERRIQHNADNAFQVNMSAATQPEAGEVETSAELLQSIAAVSRMDIKEAKDLSYALGEPVTVDEVALARRLEAVQAGTLLLDQKLREDAERIIAARDSLEAGGIAREALEEMGYAVSGEFSTLFVKGGMVHFQKPGWQGYYVRMRVKPEEHYFNLNMVRVGNLDESRDQRILDTEMEETWCEDYSNLLEEFSKHGILSSKTRAIDPGVMAVQAVSADQIPSTGQRLSKRRTRRVTEMHHG